MRRHPIRLVAVASALGILAAALGHAGPASARTGNAAVPDDYAGTPTLSSVLPASVATLFDPAPPGSNDFSCRPSPAHPEPIVLVHGLSANQFINWFYLAPILARNGYCVFSLTYGRDPRISPLSPGGVIPVQKSAPQLAAFVDSVLRATGATKVDLLGHSEGTFMPQYWLKFLGGAAKVDDYIAMTPLYDGTKLGGVDMLRDLGTTFGLSDPVIALVENFCGSCAQFLAGSPMQRLLAAGGKAVPGVRYTTILSRLDPLVVPYTSGLLPPPARNIVVQDVCPNDVSEHVGVAYDPVVAQIILNTLDPAQAKPVNCSGLPPLVAAPLP